MKTQCTYVRVTYVHLYAYSIMHTYACTYVRTYIHGIKKTHCSYEAVMAFTYLICCIDDRKLLTYVTVCTQYTLSLYCRCCVFNLMWSTWSCGTGCTCRALAIKLEQRLATLRPTPAPPCRSTLDCPTDTSWQAGPHNPPSKTLPLRKHRRPWRWVEWDRRTNGPKSTSLSDLWRRQIRSSWLKITVMCALYTWIKIMWTVSGLSLVLTGLCRLWTQYSAACSSCWKSTKPKSLIWTNVFTNCRRRGGVSLRNLKLVPTPCTTCDVRCILSARSRVVTVLTSCPSRTPILVRIRT